MKAADISDETILEIVGRSALKLGATVSEICDGLPQFPYKVVMAKLRQMVNKKRLAGCVCGCRGDFRSIQ